MSAAAGATAVVLDDGDVARIVAGRWAAAPPRADAVSLAARFAAGGVRPYAELGVLRSRETMEAVVRLQREADEPVDVEDVLVPGQHGHLPARVYRPARPARAEVPRPLVVYVHGGGWIGGSIATAERPCMRLALAADAVVVSVAYRLAPESPFPAPLEDCVAALSWLGERAGELGAHGNDVTVLGDSAGGNLVAASTALLRDRGAALPRRQVLLYPCLQPAQGSPFRSYAEFAEDPFMPAGDLRWAWAHYAGDGGDLADPRLAPLLARDLRGLPPTSVLLAERDVLRDEGVAYAARLRDAGVPVAVTLFRGAPHGFWWMDRALAQADELTGELAAIARGGRDVVPA